MFKAKNTLIPKNVSYFFDTETENHYNQKHRTESRIAFINLVFHGSEIISCFGPKICDIVPSELKQTESPNGFKKSIIKWMPANFPFRLSSSYRSGVDLI